MEGDFIITTPENVRGIIEVKSRLDATGVVNAIKNATTNASIIGNGKIFNGVFSFEKDGIITRDNERNATVNDNFVQALKNSNGSVNHLCLGKDYFVKFWSEENPRLNDDRACYSFYNIENLSFSYFISNVIETVIRNFSEHELTNRNWFLFPIQEQDGKEHFNIKNQYLDVDSLSEES